MLPESAHNQNKKVQILPNFTPNHPQTLPKSFQDPPKIDPKGLLAPMLDPCLKKARFWTSKIRTKVAQERPEEAQDRPKPFPNEAQDLPKSKISGNFWLFFSNSKFALIFGRMFIDLLLFFKGSTYEK